MCATGAERSSMKPKYYLFTHKLEEYIILFHDYSSIGAGWHPTNDPFPTAEEHVGDAVVVCGEPASAVL
jgi:hypothetical protein